MEKLYFAYGSNLDTVDWQVFCRGEGLCTDALVPVARAWLPDHDLAFTRYSRGRRGGVLDVVPCPGGLVEGFLFRVTDACLAALDRKEGHPFHYRRHDVFVIDDKGERIEAFTYSVLPHIREAYVEPARDYPEICMRGRREHDLGTDALERAAANEPSRPLEAFFFYGTLMRGERFCDAWIDAGVRCTLLAETWGRLCDHGAYPGLVLGGDRLVQGEFVAFDLVACVLPRLDRIEGFFGFGHPDNLFDRTLVSVGVGDGRVRRAWTYVTRRPTGDPIASNDWRERNGLRRLAISAVVEEHARGLADFEDRVAQADVYSFGAAPLASREEIVDAVSRGHVSERTLARASGNWAVRFGPRALRSPST